MIKNNIVGLAGKMFSGKTTASKFFTENKDWERLRFATHLKKVLSCFLDISGYEKSIVESCVDGDLKGEVLPDIGLTSRWMLQNIGSDFPMTNNYHHVWRNITIKSALDVIANGKNVIIDDVRFAQEADDIQKHGGYTVFIDRKSENQKVNNIIIPNLYLPSGKMSDKLFLYNMIEAIDSVAYDIESNIDYKLPDNFSNDFRDFVIDKFIPVRFTNIHEQSKKHISENSLPEKFDYIIDNNGTYLDLKNNVSNLILDIESNKKNTLKSSNTFNM